MSMFDGVIMTLGWAAVWKRDGVAQATSMSADEMTEDAVYSCTGNPLPKDIEQVAHWLLNEKFTDAFESASLIMTSDDVLQVKQKDVAACRTARRPLLILCRPACAEVSGMSITKGLALVDIIQQLHTCASAVVMGVYAPVASLVEEVNTVSCTRLSVCEILHADAMQVGFQTQHAADGACGPRRPASFDRVQLGIRHIRAVAVRCCGVSI
jgi:hypothetical protein